MKQDKTFTCKFWDNNEWLTIYDINEDDIDCIVEQLKKEVRG